MAARLPFALLSGMFLLSLLAVPARGGSASAPEVIDVSDDQAVAETVPISEQPPALTTVGLNVDLQAGWVTETADALQLTIQVQGTGSPSASSATAYAFHLEVAGTSYEATAVVDLADQGGGAPGTGGITPGGVASAAVAAGDHLILLTVPKSAIGSPGAGAVLGNLFITAEGKTGGVETTISDRAPDTGAGAPYVLTGGGAAAPTVVRTTLSNSTLSVAHGFANATTALYVYNWTQGPAQANLALDVEGSGNVTIQVRDAANKTLFRRAWLESVDFAGGQALAGAAGNWTITLDYVGFKGDLKLSLERPPAPPVGTPTTTSGPTTVGHTTSRPPSSSSSSSTSEGIPGFGAALAVAGLALAAARRRLA